MRNQIISRYIDAKVYDIIGHSVWVHVWTAVWYILLALILGFIYIYVLSILQQPFLLFLRGAVLVGMYLKGLYELFDEYLDVLLITDRGLVSFRRNGLRNQRIDTLQRVSIESVSTVQDSFVDNMLDKGDIHIKLEDTTTVFRDVHSPSVCMEKVLSYKDQILGRHNYLENEQKHEPEKYDVLIEALGEVVSEYVQKKNTTEYY